MAITTPWMDGIDSYLRAERAAGKPETTIAARRQHLHNLARTIDVGDPWTLTPGQLVDWAGGRDWAQETRRSRRTTFLSFYRWAIGRQLTSTNPAAALERIKATLPNPRPCPDDVYEAALGRAGARVALMLRLAGELGLRRGEIAQIHSRDVFADLEGWSLTVHGKGGRPRDVPLTRRLAFELRGLPKGAAFPGAVAGHLSARRVGELVNAELAEGWTIHSLRHMAGTHFDERGGLSAAQDLLGHASPATTRRYVKVSADRLRAVVEPEAS